ncbi:phenylacetate--CoA ligase family protein [Chelativorans sp. YIM 93263]|uniref:phenylacetate--CoA ligase family protein n=1 Tax=Chelativorans sp. YIM 93263 TaxID=2906648 RepID=UPI002379DD5E|nr:AMP-binding protein [Chelativorans sp. YIM 93263]
MNAYFDEREVQDSEAREKDLFTRLPEFLSTATDKAPGLARWLTGIALEDIRSRQDLARLPVLRKSELLRLQRDDPPLGGFANIDALKGAHVFMSPGPIWEIQPPVPDPWHAARALFAAGVRAGDVAHNAFAYHMTPGGFMLDEGARALGCAVFPAGTGNTDVQVEAASALRPAVYCGTPDFLKIMLDRASEAGCDLSSFRIGLVSGGALFPSLRAEYAERGIRVLQCYATADIGVIAYETTNKDGEPLPGMIVNEDLIVEIVRPGTNDTVPDGEVGEVVVTSFNTAYPMVRLGTGDLSAVVSGASECGRTNMRLKGWMGRADQRTKVKGMFIDPEQVGALLKRHGEIARARLVVTREGETDAMALHVEPAGGNALDEDAIANSLRDITKLGGSVTTVPPGSLPNDGKVIADERDYAR